MPGFRFGITHYCARFSGNYWQTPAVGKNVFGTRSIMVHCSHAMDEVSAGVSDRWLEQAKTEILVMDKRITFASVRLQAGSTLCISPGSGSGTGENVSG